MHPSPLSNCKIFSSSPDEVSGFLDVSAGEESVCSAGDTGDVGLISGSGRSPRGGKCQPTLVFMSEKSHGQRSLVGNIPWDQKELNTT